MATDFTQQMTPANMPFLLFEDTYTAKGGGLAFAHPSKVLCAWQPQDVLGVLQQAETLTSEGYWLAGWISYEAGYALEPRLHKVCPSERQWPLVWLGAFARPQSLSAPEREDFWAAEVGPKPSVPSANPAWSYGQYARRFDRVMAYLLAGDAYQVNLTFPVTLPGLQHNRRLHALLRRVQPSTYCSWIETEHGQISSVSPELFIRKTGNRLVTRPMKGTAPRPPDDKDVATAAEALKADPKTRAENLMIVDLLRNDLSRVAERGSVEVTSLFDVETYADVLQVTSTVTSTSRPDTAYTDVLRALFPCGSVTGAPKIRAMEIISELEAGPRDIYTGALGWIEPTGDFRFSVAIRTLATPVGGTSVYGTGSGVVADSVAMDEYAEALHKARPIAYPKPLGDLLETFLWTAETGSWLLDRHFDRMERSATTLGYVFDKTRCATAVESLTARLNPQNSWRVRLLSSRLGSVTCMATRLAETVIPSLDPDPKSKLAGEVTAAILELDTADRRLRHKTTAREIYEEAWNTHNPLGHFIDVLLFDTQDRLIDGCRNTVVLWDGESLTTPATEFGALPGVVRQTLMEEGRLQVSPAPLTRQDVARAKALFLANGVYGLRRISPAFAPESR